MKAVKELVKSHMEPGSDQHVRGIAEKMHREMAHPKEISTLSYNELLALEAEVRSKLVRISQIANGNAMEASQQRRVGRIGSFGRLFAFEMHRLKYLGKWIDEDVDAASRSPVQELEMNLRAIRYELQKHKKSAVHSVLHTMQHHMKKLLQ